VLLAGQYSRVTEVVENLLGFQSDQFRQVVMLPRGQFRRFLLADSRERQEILEVLFQTEVYRRIEEALKQSAREIQDRLKEQESHRKFLLDQAQVESEEELRQNCQAFVSQHENLNRESLGFSEEIGFRSVDKIRHWTKPLLVIHAEHDQIIPYAEGLKLCDACPSEEKTLLKVAGAGHNDILSVGFRAYMEAVGSLGILLSHKKTK